MPLSGMGEKRQTRQRTPAAIPLFSHGDGSAPVLTGTEATAFRGPGQSRALPAHPSRTPETSSVLTPSHTPTPPQCHQPSGHSGNGYMNSGRYKQCVLFIPQQTCAKHIQSSCINTQPRYVSQWSSQHIPVLSSTLEKPFPLKKRFNDLTTAKFLKICISKAQ